MNNNKSPQYTEYKEEILVNGYSILSCLKYLHFESRKLNLTTSFQLIGQAVDGLEKEIDRMRDS